LALRDGGQAAEHTVAIEGTADIKGLAAMMASVESDPKAGIDPLRCRHTLSA
jgi:hypothetical protein